VLYYLKTNHYYTGNQLIECVKLLPDTTKAYALRLKLIYVDS